MSGVLWQKDGVEIDGAVMRFLAGEDIVLDRELLVYDIRASRVHARGLGSIGVLPKDEVERLIDTLGALETAWLEGRFVLDDRYEDGHSAIEAYLTETLGSLGGKIHLGRSRNDQVLVALRLYMRESLDRVHGLLLTCVEESLSKARAYESVPMPGYTHLQRAVPSTLGLWYASFAESFLDSASMVRSTRSWINRSPLGTAAGYGVNVPLDRETISEELGFEGIVINPMAAQASRGKHEHQVLAALWQAMQDVRRLSWDMSLFSTQEFAFLEMPNRATTGSSIMPNKRNPDLVELLRATPSVVCGCMNEIQQVVGLPSGYHRDLQLTKGPLVRGIRAATDALGLVPMLLRETVFDTDRLRSSIDPSMLATDKAVEHALSGIPFRDAYKLVGNADTGALSADVDESIRARVSPGACADLMLDELGARLAEHKLERSA